MFNNGEGAHRSAHAVGDLIDAVRRHEEAIRNQTAELEQLREAVLKAAEEEASEIVSAARADVRLVVAAARRRLVELSGSIRLAIGPQADAPPGGTDFEQSWQADARRELLKILREAKADFDQLAGDVTAAGSPSLPPESAPPESVSISTTSEASEETPDTSHATPPPLEVPESTPLFGGRPEAEPEPRRADTLKVLLAAFVSVGVLITGGTMWWARSQRQHPSAAHPPITTSERAPAIKDSPVVANHAQPSRAAQSASQRGVVLRVEVTRPTWIRTTIDGRADAGAVQQPGTPRDIKGEQEISLRVGDGGSVRVSFNGAEPTILGPGGQPMTKRFAVPSSTPTPASAAAASAARGGPDAVTTPAQSLKPREAVSSVPAAAAAPAPGDLAAKTQSSSDNERARSEVEAAAYRWLDAYYRGDPNAVASLGSGAQISDDRAAEDRMPAGLTVQRSLEGLTFQFSGDAAVLSGRMVERANLGAEPRALTSWLSQTWIRVSGEWRVIDVRLVGNRGVTAPR